MHLATNWKQVMAERTFQSISYEVHNEILIVAVLEKELRDFKVCHDLKDEILAAIDKENPTDIGLDLKNVNFVGSVGFLAFLEARRRLPDGRLMLFNVSERVEEVFRVCGLASRSATTPARLEIVASLDDVLSSHKPRS